MATAPIAKNKSVEKRAAKASPVSQPNSLIRIAPSQKASGPSCGIAKPAILGASQSDNEPCAIVHIIPKPAASSVRQGSRLSMPGTMYNKQSEIKPQRGRIVVAAAASRTGFMQAD